jgi:hypothetical protein
MEPASIANSFRIRASATADIMAGEIGLSDVQKSRMAELADREKPGAKPLTDNMKSELAKLKMKHSFPELPQGAKTYCKKWLKEFLYGRREELKNKYVNKGNACEEDGFTLMATELNLGMVYKNTERKINEYSEGTCDLDHLEIVYDNKSSWSLDTFPMFEDELPDIKYWWQLQNYHGLYGGKKLVLCYTLNDAPFTMVEDALKWIDCHDEKYRIAERMIFTSKYFGEVRTALFPNSTLSTFKEILDEKRIKPFEFLPDPEAKEKIKLRVQMCREYILTLLK